MLSSGAIYYTDKIAENAINKMDFIILYQSPVDNIGYFKNTSSNIKYHSAVKRTLVAQAKQQSRVMLHYTFANELIDPYAISALRSGCSQLSPHLGATYNKFDSRTDAICLMIEAFISEDELEIIVYLFSRNCSFSNSRSLNAHCYCLHWGLSSATFPLIKLELLLNCRL